MFKVIRSNTEIAETPPQISRLGSSRIHATGNTLQMFKVKGKRSRLLGQMSMLQRKVMYQQQKRYNPAMDRFSDFKLGITS